MSQDRVGEILITRRLLHLGNQTYPLANIARVQTLWIEWGRTVATSREIVGFLLIIVATVYVGPALRLDIPGGSLLIIALLVAAGVVVYRLVKRQRRFVLFIETSGGQSAALTAKADAELRQIEHTVLGAIENPPESPIRMQVNVQNINGDVVGRDKYQQGGSGNNVSVSN
jgi:hypothetical protein